MLPMKEPTRDTQLLTEQPGYVDCLSEKRYAPADAHGQGAAGG